ncbi:MAG: hypothetical protein K0R61_3665 [Microvirga sp.]|jgi:hypothetical protein|nr:hypothetical protein [Microvirga sp.]
MIVNCLPPLNPIDKAPKNGMPVLALQIHGWILDSIQWDARRRCWESSSRINHDGSSVLQSSDKYLGWWPMPRVWGAEDAD